MFSFLKSLCLCVCLLICAAAGQTKPRIDFDALLKEFPNLPWDFEIRYVTHNGLNTDMLRIYYDRRVDIVHWRPSDSGSLSEVCHGNIDRKQMWALLNTLHDKNFNDLPSDLQPFVSIADKRDAIVSVRVGRTIVRKIDRREHKDPGLVAIENELESIQKIVSAEPKTKCEMETVPEKP